jgi:hypothetical protein
MRNKLPPTPTSSSTDSEEISLGGESKDNEFFYYVNYRLSTEEKWRSV